LYRSSNEEAGIEFSYTLWFLVQDFAYKKGEWKHIFHKGNSTSYPNRAPGVWLHPNKNSLRIYLNTFSNILEFADIENIPIKKWVQLSIVVKQNTLDIYVNGNLKKRHVTPSLPRQNFGDVWINLFGGFDGYLSKLRYYQYAITYEDVEKIVKEGPSNDACGDTNELPPYLSDKWWHNVEF